jgi:hypothetical protein
MAKSSIEELGQLRAEREVVRNEIDDHLRKADELFNAMGGCFTKEGKALIELADVIRKLNKISIEVDDYVYGQLEMMLKFGAKIDEINKSPEMPVMPNAAVSILQEGKLDP